LIAPFSHAANWGDGTTNCRPVRFPQLPHFGPDEMIMPLFFFVTGGPSMTSFTT
jgi:hypothetical protein